MTHKEAFNRIRIVLLSHIDAERDYRDRALELRDWGVAQRHENVRIAFNDFLVWFEQLQPADNGRGSLTNFTLGQRVKLVWWPSIEQNMHGVEIGDTGTVQGAPDPSGNALIYFDVRGVKVYCSPEMCEQIETAEQDTIATSAAGADDLRVKRIATLEIEQGVLEVYRGAVRQIFSGAYGRPGAGVFVGSTMLAGHANECTAWAMAYVRCCVERLTQDNFPPRPKFGVDIPQPPARRKGERKTSYAARLKRWRAEQKASRA